jgi:hypothetical protein
VSPDAPLPSSFSLSSSSSKQQQQQKFVTFAEGPAFSSASDKENVFPNSSLKTSIASRRGKVTPSPPSSRVPLKGATGFSSGNGGSSNKGSGKEKRPPGRVVSIDLDLDEVLGNLDALSLVSAAMRELEGL